MSMSSYFLFRFSELASVSDVLTVEIEHVNTEPLLLLEQAGYSVQPKSSTIKLIQVGLFSICNE